MKRVLIILAFYLSMVSVFATEASDFAQKQYGECIGNKNIRIKVEKEHTQEYQQPIGDKMIPAITYGYGFMKVKGEKKTRITYICLLDENCEPFWSIIVPTKKY